MSSPVGAYVHVTNDTTNQTNLPGTASGITLIKVIVNQKAAAASLLTLKDGTNVIAVIDVAATPSGTVMDFSVLCAATLSRTFSTTSGATSDLTFVLG